MTNTSELLVEFFREEGYRRFGWNGDAKGWSPEQTAIEAMRELMALEKRSPSPSSDVDTAKIGRDSANRIAALRQSTHSTGGQDRDALQEQVNRIHGAISDYGDMAPEEDETWESWYHAAFDLLSQKVREATDKIIAHRSPSTGQQDELGAIARIVNPRAFQYWQDLFDAGILDGLSPEKSREQADRCSDGAIPKALAKADAIRALAHPEQESAPASVGVLRNDCVMVPKSALAWLFGEGTDADGKWFGECEDIALGPDWKFPRRYWWRSKFRSMIAALSEPTP